MNNPSYTEWCNANEGRAYPISETATRVDDNGVQLPDDVVVDLCVLLPYPCADIRISTVYTSPTILSVAISTAAGLNLTGSFARASIIPYRAYALTSLSDNVSGWIVFGNHKSSVVEHYRFASVTQSGLEQRTLKVIPPPGVNRFQRIGNSPEQYASGIVRLIGTNTIQIIQDPLDPQNILVSLAADRREAFCEPCTRTANTRNCGVPVIRRINNVPADPDGKITLRFE